MFNFYFIIRRLISVAVLVLIDDYPFFQSTSLTILSTINLIYVVSVYPMERKLANRIEVLNELLILCFCHIMTLFLNDNMPDSLNDDLGWVLIAFIAINVTMNLAIVLS